jgi:predicted O-methyltransferase YrrM
MGKQTGRTATAPTLPTYLARALKSSVTEPRDTIERLMEKSAKRLDRVRRHESGPQMQADEDWERKLHAMIGAEWPCAEREAFAETWADVEATMAGHGLRMGRRSYGGDDDADPGLARALWCLVHHLQPAEVVETGVAHGVSSRVILEALARNEEGRLSSIDLPWVAVPERGREVGVAVPEALRDRWLFLEGSSRRRLPPLLRRRGQIDLFLHDSLHSTRNVRWELMTAWRALRPGGFAVVDDVDFNWGFPLFLEAGNDRRPLYCIADDRQRLFAVARKHPAPATTVGTRETE